MGLWGGFAMAVRDGTITVSLSAIEDVTSTTADLIAKLMQAFERMLEAALPRIESYERTVEAQERWKTQT